MRTSRSWSRAARLLLRVPTARGGGRTRDNTLNVLDKVLAQHPGIPVASHLTCVGSTADELRRYIEDAIGRGVKTIVALRGDPPEAVENFLPVSGGLRYANELVSLINREFPDIGVIVCGGGVSGNAQ